MKAYETMYVKKLNGTNRVLKMMKKEQCEFLKQNMNEMDYITIHSEWLDDISNENMDVYKVLDVSEMRNYDSDLKYLVLPRHYGVEFMGYQLFPYERIKIVK